MQENKLYVGGIPYSATNTDLQNYFAQAGEVVKVMIVMDKLTNRSKGFGFVEMVNESAAQKAISMFHDREFMGRRLTVNLARPIAPREERLRRNY